MGYMRLHLPNQLAFFLGDGRIFSRMRLFEPCYQLCLLYSFIWIVVILNLI